MHSGFNYFSPAEFEQLSGRGNQKLCLKIVAFQRVRSLLNSRDSSLRQKIGRINQNTQLTHYNFAAIFGNQINLWNLKINIDSFVATT